MYRSMCVLAMLLALLPLPASATWLEFGAGCPEGSEPRVFHDITLDDRICFDVELQGLLADTVVHDSIPYLRFHESPGTTPLDSTGFPELPVVVCFVAVPDDADLDLSYSANCPETLALTLPVYPAPLDSLVADSSGSSCIAEDFRKNSTAYTSEEWFPEELAEIVGEFHLRDQRVAIVAVHPMQYLASEDSLRVWGDLEMSVLLDGEELDWNQDGLGYYDLLVGDVLLGYHPDYEPIGSHDAQVYRHEHPLQEPPIDPDYVILVADGLDGADITAHAEYRSIFNNFDVLIANTEDIREAYAPSAPKVTDVALRQYLEAVWNWTTPSTRPTYLLLVGNHSDPTDQLMIDWVLPTHLFQGYSSQVLSANDGWFSYFGESLETDLSFPNLITGRISSRNRLELQSMLALIRGIEAPLQYPGSSMRRHLVRLSGTEGGLPGDCWVPSHPWTTDLSDWLGYDLTNHYCGDGDPTTSIDGSTLSSRQWIEACRDAFETGSQVLFYTDHGSMHYFACGLNEDPTPAGWLGQRDSTFDDLDIRELESTGQGYTPPFVLLASCAQNTFNLTNEQHYTFWPHWNCCNGDPEEGPVYDFGMDCFAEELMKNTDCGVVGVFGASMEANGSPAASYAVAILEELFYSGYMRIGDGIQAARFQLMDEFHDPESGSWIPEIGLFNLLGDPAVDIGDRVAFPSYCDLVIAPTDLAMSPYPTQNPTGTAGFYSLVSVRNAGGSDAGAFDVDLILADDENHHSTLTAECTGLEAGEEKTFGIIWSDIGWFTPPGALTLTAEAENPGGRHPDSWMDNNDATVTVVIRDLYPNEEGWPALLPGSVQSPPCLADVDGDGDLEIAALSGMSTLGMYEPDGSLIWQVQTPSTVNVGSACEVFAAGNVCGTSAPEIVVDCRDQLCVYDGGNGELLYSFSHDDQGFNWQNPHPVTLADIVTEVSPEIPRDEIAFLCNGDLHLLRVQNHELVQLDREAYPTGFGSSIQGWVAAADLDGSSPTELVISLSDAMSQTSFLGLYRYQSGQGSYYDTRTWQSEISRMIPAIGSLYGLSGTRIAVSRKTSSAPHVPAFILDPLNLSSTPISCQHPGTVSNQLLCCMMADWQVAQTGLDRVLASAENQSITWESDGDVDWYDLYSTPDAYLPPFGALGDLDHDGMSDLLVGTRSGMVQAYKYNGDPLSTLDFPYTLPAQVTGGYCIADIDGDGKVEVVFGTMDNYLHVWELGSCTAGYAPWPQVQHDAARTGALE